MNTHRIPGLVLTAMEFEVPLDHNRPQGERISVFARAAVALDKEHDNLPWLVFFHGGPGFSSPRPTDLSDNKVPGAAAVYYDDMYVERTFSEETAQHIPGLKVWITNEYQHNGLRADGEKVLGRLLDLARGNVG